MNSKAMAPYGLALRAYNEGETDSLIVIRRDDGFESPLPAAIFFRSPEQFLKIEEAALERCRGRVLDIGAGTGIHSLVLQSRGLSVTAVDINPQAAEIMVERGVRDVQVVDVLSFRGGPYDTLLLLGRGIGMAEDLDGLDGFLSHARQLVTDTGQLLINSLDVRKTDEPSNLKYHDANRRAGRYVGQTRVQFVFQGTTGPFCGWLHVDAETLAERATESGWACEILLVEDSGDYIACLTPALHRNGG
jgi:SAM-dependent methyltransferase